MFRLSRITLTLALLALLGWQTPARTDDEEPKLTDEQKMDLKLYNDLRAVINRGADMYNKGDKKGCYQLFQNELNKVRKDLDHHPELQEKIDAQLAAAARNVTENRRAFALRAMLDEVRAELKASAEIRTIWVTLGGSTNVRKIVDEAIPQILGDPAINLRGPDAKEIDEKTMATIKRTLVNWISSKSGGSKKNVDEDSAKLAGTLNLKLTEEQFNRSWDIFKATMAKNEVKPEDIDNFDKNVVAKLKSKLSFTRSSDDPPPDDKKPDDKKPDDKKPDDKKPDDKKKEEKPK